MSYNFIKTLVLQISIITMTIGCSSNKSLQDAVNYKMAGISGTIVFIDLSSDKEIVYNSQLANARTTPCSTFKIWNTLIGVENNLINSENDLFYKWDGEVRAIADWNKNLTLKEAFQFSCVPAYQILAIKTGSSNMQKWINKIGYGDRNISAGIDIFWLSRPNKKSIKISPKEQALLIKKLVNDQLEFTDKSKQILKTVMLYKQTEQSTLYGKTGSGQNIDDITDNNIGWYVGYVINKNGNYSFSCLINDKKASGNVARQMIEQILIESKLL